MTIIESVNPKKATKLKQRRSVKDVLKPSKRQFFRISK